MAGRLARAEFQYKVSLGFTLSNQSEREADKARLARIVSMLTKMCK